MKIILASASERRQELLNRIVEDFKIVISNFDETSVQFHGDCHEYVKELALGKAREVADRSKDENIVIGADTIVYHGGKILGKPKDMQDACSMLKNLSGNSHIVYSGIAVINTAADEVRVDSVCSEVFFSELSQEQIDTYAASSEPMDKAGSYGIQGKGGVFVEKIHGDYYNVVGLPLNRLYYMLKEMGVNL
jgi:septum formation protein